jgi:multidrug transporter EmrE-like cation transporter
MSKAPTEWINGVLTEKYNDEALRWALLMTAIESVGDASLKQSARTPDDIAFLLTGVGAYNAQSLVFREALKDNKLGIVNAYWNGMTNITNALIGMAMGEEYTIHQGIGILLITAGILLI